MDVVYLVMKQKSASTLETKTVVTIHMGSSWRWDIGKERRAQRGGHTVYQDMNEQGGRNVTLGFHEDEKKIHWIN